MLYWKIVNPMKAAASFRARIDFVPYGVILTKYVVVFSHYSNPTIE
jgi:hypothetical protein